ncbi:hypothetical protein PIROE2DRAFT_11078 [Piromyces sp. E2]|nr:hypothetical protein PIROE2DRAFT_11078 [Piromyces sp. E2]|eukprot:OUM62596.1 hypothetical protein PIROE2DRAFT_11078 [Piromyces sp. E2]
MAKPSKKINGKKVNENEDKTASKDKSKKNGKGGNANDNDKVSKNQESIVEIPELTQEELERIEKEKQLEEQRLKELEEEKRKAEEMIIQITPEDIINERIKILPLDLQLLRYGLSNPGLAPDGKSVVYLRLSLEVFNSFFLNF